MVLRERSYDYQFRYCGHCNTTTDIKEANFFGRSEALKRRRAQPCWQQEVGVGVGGMGTQCFQKSLTSQLCLCTLGQMASSLWVSVCSPLK